jgi:hypothetical protein
MPIHNGPSIGDVVGLPSALRMGKFVDRGNFFALCGQNATWSDGTNGVQSARWPATFNTDCTGLQFCYANWIAGPTEQANTNAVIIRASLETPAGTFWQFLFNGRKGAVVDGGAQILSDPLSIPLLASLGKVYYRITVAVALPPSSLAVVRVRQAGARSRPGRIYWKVTTSRAPGSRRRTRRFRTPPRAPHRRPR